MIIRAKGARAGIKEYLEKGQMKGRFFDRDQLDSREILANGDLGIVDDIINNISNDGEKYFHITLSFKEDFISKETLNNIALEFRDFYFKAYTDEEICFYAEAHLPKIKSYRDRSTNEIVERKPHIHVVVPKINLLTGLNLDTTEKYNIPYMDAFQEYINCKYGLESPKDNRRVDFNNKSEVISRYKGDLFKGLGKDAKTHIFQLIMDNNPNSSKELQDLLAQNGYLVRVRNAGKIEQAYLNVLPDGEAKGINLKEFVFCEEFLQLSKEDKNSYIYHKNEYKNLTRENRILLIEQNREKSNLYLKAGLSRPVAPLYLTKLQEWNDTIAYQRKYVDRMGSKSVRAKFKGLSAQEKMDFLKHREEQFYTKYGVQEYGITKSELGKILDIYQRVAFNHLQSAGANSRKSSEDVERHSGDKISPIDAEWRRERGEEYARIVGSSQGRHVYDSVGREYNSSENRRRSFVDALTVDYINDKMSRDELKQELDYFKKTIKADVLLELSQKVFGSLPEKYRITINKAGSERILCGDHNYSVVDFCIKELNLPWNDSLKLLKATELMQREVDRERGWTIHDDQYLSVEYNSWLVSFKNTKDAELTALQSEVKVKYDLIAQKYKSKNEDLAKSGDGYHKREEGRRLLKMEKLLENRALFTARNKDLEIIKSKYNLDMQESYRKFLVEMADLGDDRALHELRRLRVDFEEYQKTGSIRHVDRYDDYRLNVSHVIDNNGVITYTLTQYSEGTKAYISRDIIKDMGKRIDILDNDAHNLKLAFDLAMSKYGRHIELFGSADLRKQLVELAVKNNYKVTFKDVFSENYRKEFIAKLQKEYLRLEEQNKVFLKENAGKVKSLLVVNVAKVDTLDRTGKYFEVAKVVLFDINTKKEYELSGSQLTSLERSGKLNKGDLLTIDAGVQNRISVDPYFWNKYKADLNQGVLISDFILDDKLVIEFPSWRQAKYKDEYFTINQSGLSKKLESIGYLHGDLVAIKPSINLEAREIDYQFQIIGDGPFKAQAKKDILETDIAKVKSEFSVNNNIKPEEINKEICGKVIDFGVGQFKGAQSSFIVMENSMRKINPEVLSLKEDFCRKHSVAMYNLDKENVGKVVGFGAAKFDEANPKSPQSFYLKLKTDEGERKIWGKDLERMVVDNKVRHGDHIYVAMIGEVKVNDANKAKVLNRFESMHLSEQQMKHARDFTASLYSRHWNTQFKEMIDNNQLVKNNTMFIAKVGETTVVEHQKQKEFIVKPIDLSMVKQEIAVAKEVMGNNSVLVTKTVAGEILEHGIGKYNDTSSPSYFMNIKRFDGATETLWGKDLERLVKDLNLEQGKYIYISKSAGNELTNGYSINNYNAQVLEKTTQQVNEYKSQINTANKNAAEINFNKTLIGTVVDCGTRSVHGEDRGFVKIQPLVGPERVYWDKDLRTISGQISKGETVYFGQIKEQQLTKEIKQDRFNCALAGNDINIRAVELIKRREIDNSRTL